jgi:hypothetical protein
MVEIAAVKSKAGAASGGRSIPQVLLQWLVLAVLAACMFVDKAWPTKSMNQPSRRQLFQTNGQQQVYAVDRFKGSASSRGAHLSLFVGVLSAGKNREARDAIRATWGAHPALYSVRFFLLRPRNETVLSEVGRRVLLCQLPSAALSQTAEALLRRRRC